jgi:hypothetical protein
MDTSFKIDLLLDEAQREELFPMQELVTGPVDYGTERPAAVVFAERLAVGGCALAAPVFVP